MSLGGVFLGLGACAFGVAGLGCLAGFAVFFKHRSRFLGSLDLPANDWRYVMLFWVPFIVGTLLSGLSMLAASVLIWTHLRLGLGLGLWPVLAWIVVGIQYQIRAAKGQAPDPSSFLGPK